jgi:hypothetical protein
MAKKQNPGALAGATGVEKPSHAIAAGLPNIAERHEKRHKHGIGMAAGTVHAMKARKDKPTINMVKPALLNCWPKLTYSDRNAFLARLDQDLNFSPKDAQE